MANEYSGPLRPRRPNLWPGFHPQSSRTTTTCQYRVRQSQNPPPNFQRLQMLCRVGTVLYTFCIQVLGILHQPSFEATKRIYPPPPAVTSTLTAGLLAGSIQALFAAPLDALQSRFHASDLISGKYEEHMARLHLHPPTKSASAASSSASASPSPWDTAFSSPPSNTSRHKPFYNFVTSLHSHLSISHPPERDTVNQTSPPPKTVRPHIILEPLFLLLAGMTASVRTAIDPQPPTASPTNPRKISLFPLQRFPRQHPATDPQHERRSRDLRARAPHVCRRE